MGIYRWLWVSGCLWVSTGIWGYIGIYGCLYLVMGFKLFVLVFMGGWMDGWESIDGCVGSDGCIDAWAGGGGIWGSTDGYGSLCVL